MYIMKQYLMTWGKRRWEDMDSNQILLESLTKEFYLHWYILFSRSGHFFQEKKKMITAQVFEVVVV